MLVAMSIGQAEGQAFGRLPDGAEARLYTLRAGAVTAQFTDYGARLVALEAPDRAGRLTNVILGFGAVETYAADTTFLGATVGRYANRIRAGQFTLGGERFQVPCNNGENALHGGTEGFDRKLWQARAVDGGLECTLVSPDGDMGFPGTLTVAARYTLVETPGGVALHIAYSATTDAETVVNVTNHAYFNLAGESAGAITGHRLLIPAERYTPVDRGLIPTGELAPVAGTPFDFREAREIGARLAEQNEQLTRAGGYDHNWVFGEPGVMKVAARLEHPASGRTLTVETTKPGMQFYSGNFLKGASPNRAGGVYGFRDGLCLETQHYPDSPNRPEWPSTTLRPGGTMRSTTIYTFGVQSGTEEQA